MIPLRLQFAILFSLVCLSSFAEPIPDAIRSKLELSPFYQQYVDAAGLPIIGSTRVHDAALQECAWMVRKMLANRPDLLIALADAKVRFAIMAHDEYTTDLPEQSSMTPRVYWDRRARGLGATLEVPVVSGGEENLLAFPGDPYPTEIIPLHEFAHAIHLVGLAKVDPSFDARLHVVYERAKSSGLWQGTYAAVNAEEYWAECVQSWFDNNAVENALHNFVNTRAELIQYDPGAAELCREVFGDNEWRYQHPEQRVPADRIHLASFNVNSKPVFRWRDEPVPDRPEIRIDTAQGEIKLQFTLSDDQGNELPNFGAVARYLDQAQQGWYSSGSITINDGKLILKAAEKTPSGTPTKTDLGVWTIQLADESTLPAGSIGATILSGSDTLKAIQDSSDSHTVAVQRTVRLN